MESVREAKLKIDLSSGHIEVEGSETFVSSIFPEIMELLNRDTTIFEKQQPNPDAAAAPEKAASTPSTPAIKKKRVSTTPSSIPPIPIDLKGRSSGISLVDFINQKEPDRSNAQELVTAFIYYLTKHGGLKEVAPGHLVSCYNEISERKPTNIPSILTNIKARKAYIAFGEEKGTYIISIAGENFIEHDLKK